MPQEAWSYALLLILLCAIASIAVWQTIDFLSERLPDAEFRVAAAALWALTLGFMLIAGAFGLWATQFAAVAETRRRVSRMVEAMDYIRDAVVAVDGKGRVRGANPSAKALAQRPELDRQYLHNIFTCISDEDVILLTNTNTPNEIERPWMTGQGPRVLRFRSQPSRNVSMIIISDITAHNEQKAHDRQAAHLQLVGEISRGVAHDFNTLLCEMSGHASIVHKLAPAHPDLQASTQAIIRASERGVALSGQLLALAQTEPKPAPARHPDLYVQHAVSALRNMLSEHWQVETDIEQLPFLALTGPQLEQIVLNLGLLAADSLRHAGILTVAARRAPAAAPRGHDTEAVIEIDVRRRDAPHPARFEPAEGDAGAPTGVIQSVIRSLLAELHGSLEPLRGPYGAICYRLHLPSGQTPDLPSHGTEFPEELAAYVSGWSVLLVTPQREFNIIEAHMRDLDMKVQRTSSIMSALTQIEQAQLDALLLDAHVIEQELQGMLRAILKLQPAAGIVVLCDTPDTSPDALRKDIVFLPSTAPPDTVLHAMVEAKSLGVHRTAADTG